eukprot:TRINITY_DN47995_c0_g1_i1.p1 TRINITY_DN47995_c0_g1~~TRINITY_DN47995_c0_g1_i1.p1  ORF type:complete len:915 (-),score=214.66 TRINITY_DN47995_c0_g1_i1:165-2909(-)
MFKRILDKKPRVREASAEAAARLYAKHALPAWMEGRYEEAQRLSWIPQLLCEAYSVFAGGRLGHVAQLEAYVEQHVLGCGAKMKANERAMALLGFCSSAAKGPEPSVRGLAMLLGRKRDANAALRNFLRLRMAKAAPVLEPNTIGVGAIVPVPSEGAETSAPTDQALASTAVENLCKLSPTLEDKVARPEALLVHLRALDAIRDKALWTQLERISNPCIKDSTEDMPALLGELDRLLRVHRLAEIAPLLRRSLVSTWILPEQVPALLEVWAIEDQPPLAEAAAQLIGDLPRYFPGAFLPHLEGIATHLSQSSTADARAALRALAAIGKRIPALMTEGAELPSGLDVAELVGSLLEAIGVSGEDVATRGSACRKAAKVVALLPNDKDRSAARGKLLAWAKDNFGLTPAASEQDEAAGAAASASAASLHLAAACLEQTERPDNASDLVADWLKKALSVLEKKAEESSEIRCAAAELLAVVGREDDILEHLLQPTPVAEQPEVPAIQAPAGESGEAAEAPVSSESLPTVVVDPFATHAACCALRSLRRGTMLTTRMLAAVANCICDILAPTRPTSEAEKLLTALQGLHRPPSSSQVKLADRLRLCTSLPTVFALAPLKRHRDPVQRVLQASLLKATRQCSTRQEPLLDYTVACFIHFLSRLDVFRKEASAKASAFPESSKVSAYFCEALLRSDLHRGAELAGVALRVCDRVRYFVDKEEPKSDAVHRAASVLRYVVEKRCPELGVQGGALLQGASRGSMPANLFAIRQSRRASVSQAAATPIEAPPPAADSIVAVEDAASSPGQSSRRLSVESPQARALSQGSSEPAVSPAPAGTLTTPRRRQSLLKKNTSSSSPEVAAVASEGSMAVSSVARPMGALSPAGVTGAAVMAALSAASKKGKRSRTSSGGSQAKQQRTA